jgi:serpin B
MKTQFLLVCILTALTIGACKVAGKSSDKKDAGQGTSLSSDSKGEISHSMRKNYDHVQQSMTDFAFRFFQFQSREKVTENFCISPVSLQIALGMTYPGARHETAEQMRSVLGFDQDIEKFLTEIGAYAEHLRRSEADTGFEFAFANRIYVEQTYDLLKSYTEQLQKYFAGSFETVDFLFKADAAELVINKWVEQTTKNRIRELIPKGLLDSSTLMVLVNAIYFKSDWKIGFDEKLTAEKPFYFGDGSSDDLKFMIAMREQMNYAFYGDWQVLEIPYITEDFSFLVILPAKSTVKNLSSLVPDAEDYEKMIRALQPNEVYMEIPRFKIESSYKLEEMMMNMGMPLAFSDDADFSGISGRRDIKISKILQKVFFEVTEKGSEAAAATAVVMIRTTSVAPEMKEPVTFIANRPFIFILKENAFHTPLFMGQFAGF